MAVRSILPTAILALTPIVSAFTQNSSLASTRRGYVYVTPTESSDLDFWTDSTNDLTWYYNYQDTPTDAITTLNKDLEFVPMLWGAPSDPSTDMTFYNSVKSQLAAGTNITYVLGFNEPDGTTATGGSGVTPADAAAVWKQQFEPLRELGIKLGAPACTGASSGFTWLQEWHTACAALSSNGSGCVVDFIPIHWYGNFEGLASHLGQVNGTYPNASAIWVTEYAYADQDLDDAQSFYNSSADYFDSLDTLTHYSYFGAFRSDVSNVGPYTAMLNQDGQLTDIGAWYLGYDATGVESDGSTTTSSSTSSSTSSASTSSSGEIGDTTSGANVLTVLSWTVACVVGTIGWSLL